MLISLFRRLDRIPSVQSPGVGLVGFVIVLGLAARLAYSGEPIAVPVEEGPDSNNEVPEGDKLWVHISGDRFNMGSNEHESDQPIHAVTISPFLRLQLRRGVSRMKRKES